MISKSNKFIKYASIAATAIVALAASLSSNNINLSKNILRGSAVEVSKATITFNGSLTSRSSNVFTTSATTSTGGVIICKTTYNDSTISGNYIGVLRNTSTLKFYESDGVTEYTFEDLDKITLYYGYATSKFNISYLYDDGVSGTIEYGDRTGSSRSADFTGASYGNVSNISYDWKSSDNVCITKIEIIYNCSTKYQTGLTIDTQPEKTIYDEGDRFDSTGMIVKANYSNGKSVATNNYTISPNRALLPTDTYVSIMFGGYSANVSITVNEVSFDGTYTYASGSSSFSLTLEFGISETEGTGLYLYENSSNSSLNGQQHFTWSLTGTTITFTKVNDPSDYQGDTGSYYYLFSKSGDYKDSNTGTVSGVALKIYTCSNSFRTSSSKTFTKA